ncbi:hypothetical protein NJG16_05265 [Stenotrophomonas maltophilia]|nr:hypothetical protein [Stenotrophomonas maltophilia]
MSTDKTLADMQPGGRVRLGDQLVLAKLVGAAGLMLAEIDTCGHEVDPAYRRTLYEAWEEGKAALSADPSPGGQGDALLREVSAQLESLDCGACIGSDAPMEDLHGRIAAHLAARQPVGEVIAWHWPSTGVVCSAEAVNRDCAPTDNAVPLYAAPAQAVDLGQFRDLARSWIVEAGGTAADTKHACADELLALIDGKAVGNG